MISGKLRCDSLRATSRGAMGGSRHKTPGAHMTLERVLLAAASAIASALATLGFLKWRRRRKVSPACLHAVWSLLGPG